MGVRTWWQRRREPAVALDTRSDLVVVAASFDDAESCSAALDRAAAWDPGTSALLRHHLRIPADRTGEVVRIAAQDGYTPVTGDDGILLLQREQLLDALHCSQERARMAGLAQRHDGTALGWEALQPGSPAGR
ncbi:hypothetical protein [Nocardia sp. BMG111209]|uniref:hypothetical protein n=1 Tax=Nocardia sp. BMG111209 TaxID=1160137 RepID=UPI000371F275|nr:hypothetical protein [Nocardia sp. BMG111209]